MARVNVEEGAWKKFYKVANYMDWDVRIACGAVIGVWHESQEKVRLTASALELARWGNEHEDADKFVAALVDAEVVRPVDDEFEIVGNENEIASQMKFRARSKKGGEATKAKWEAAKASQVEKKSRKHSLKPATSPLEAGHTLGHQLGTIQCSSVQYNSEEKNKETNLTVCTDEKSDSAIEVKNGGELAPQNAVKPPTLPGKRKFTPETNRKIVAFIRAYAEGFREKYKSAPEGIRDKAVIGKIGHWVEMLSEERAVQLVQVYLQVTDKWVVARYHDLWTFFKIRNQLGVALDTGLDPGGINFGSVFGGGK